MQTVLSPASPGPVVRDAARMPADVAATMIADSLSALGADAGFVATVDPDHGALEIARMTPYARHPVRFTLPREAPYPLAEAIRTREPLFIENNDQLKCDNPGLVRIRSEDHSCATVPLLDESGELLGALNLGFDEPRAFSARDYELIDLLARHCSEAMSLAHQLEAEFRR
ncbi:MAG: GAF domain-containing protein [Actinomycetota bacterium]|nr:GAF domain-containing protein [Actinomycetota bacterium]